MLIIVRAPRIAVICAPHHSCIKLVSGTTKSEVSFPCCIPQKIDKHRNEHRFIYRIMFEV